MMTGPKRYRGLGISERHEAALMNDVRFEGIDYSREEQVMRAREAITGMGMLDRVIDWVCRHGEEERTLNVMADMVLCHHADIWKQKYPHAELAQSVSKLNRDEVQVRFMDLLSPEGRRVMLGRHVNTPSGIRFFPTTGTKLDAHFSVTLPHDEAKKLLQSMAGSPNGCFGDVVDVWQQHRMRVSSAAAMMALATADRGRGAHCSAASAHGTAALCFAEAGYLQAAAEAHAMAVQDLDSVDEAGQAAAQLGELAKMWEANDRHDFAAKAWADQAERYQALDWQEPAAEARGRQARCAADARLHDIAQAGWLAQADIYRFLDRHDQAQESRDQAEKQGELHRAFERNVLPPEMVHEIAKHLGPADVMSLAAASKPYRSAITSPDVLDAIMQRLEAMPPSAYMAELHNGLPSLNRLYPNSRVGALQLLVAKLNTLLESDRQGAFDTLLSAAADLPRRAQLQVVEALSRSIELLEPSTRAAAWSKCLEAIEIGNGKASRLPAWVALLDSLPSLLIDERQLFRKLVAAADALKALEPSDPDKRPLMLAVASQLKMINERHRVNILWRLYDDLD